MQTPIKPPKPIAACISSFSMLGLLAVLCGPLFFFWLRNHNERDALTYVLCGGMALWGALALLVAYAIKKRQRWSRPAGYILAVPIVGGAITTVPAIMTIINLSKSEWKV